MTGFAFVIYFRDSDFSDPDSNNNKKLGDIICIELFTLQLEEKNCVLYTAEYGNIFTQYLNSGRVRMVLAAVKNVWKTAKS